MAEIECKVNDSASFEFVYSKTMATFARDEFVDMLKADHLSQFENSSSTYVRSQTTCSVLRAWMRMRATKWPIYFAVYDGDFMIYERTR